MKTLKYWYITAVRKGEWKGCIAHGIVHGHQRLADGIKIHTSAISTVTIVNDTAIIKTKNSEYYCRLNEASSICLMNLESAIFPISRNCERRMKGGLRCPDKEMGY